MGRPFDMYACARKHAGMSSTNHKAVELPLGRVAAQEVARLMGALSTASRVQILARLMQGPCSVGELSSEAEMEQPAVSHQLRILRDMGLVIGNRQGRHVVYRLFDSHVAALIAEALRHIDHVATDGPVPRKAEDGPTPRRRETEMKV